MQEKPTLGEGVGGLGLANCEGRSIKGDSLGDDDDFLLVAELFNVPGLPGFDGVFIGDREHSLNL